MKIHVNLFWCVRAGDGQATLVGYVDNETDVHLATLRSNSVPNVFSVTNNLKVAQRG